MIDTGPFEALAEFGVALAGFTGVVVENPVRFADVVGWFGKHLRSPEQSSYSLPYHSREFNRVIFWLKGTAHEHVQRMQEVARMLRYHHVPARVLKTSRPGRVVYEDEHQVGAIPFRDGVT